MRKVVPFEHKYGTDGKCWQKLTKARKCWQKMLKVGKVAKCREQLRKVEKIWEKLAHNGPFELSAGLRERRERVRSLNLRQFEPPKTFPGLKNVKNVSKKLGDPVS